MPTGTALKRRGISKNTRCCELPPPPKAAPPSEREAYAALIYELGCFEKTQFVGSLSEGAVSVADWGSSRRATNYQKK